MSVNGNTVGGIGLERTYILQDAHGNEFVGVMVDNDVVFNATPNDVRKGKIAANETGVFVGEKIIPKYYTTYGYKLIPPGSEVIVQILDNGLDLADYTKLQALICRFEQSISGSVATKMVAVDEHVYNVQSTDKISTIIKDVDNNVINFSIINTSEEIWVIRYVTSKEVI